eukprot:3397600-Pleurochrysis_carterae.AAC.1
MYLHYSGASGRCSSSWAACTSSTTGARPTRRVIRTCRPAPCGGCPRVRTQIPSRGTRWSHRGTLGGCGGALSVSRAVLAKRLVPSELSVAEALGVPSQGL